MSEATIATRIHLLPPPGTVLFACDKCGFLLAVVDYAPRGDYRFIKLCYRQQIILARKGQVLERRVACPHCNAANLIEPDFAQHIATD